MKCKASAQGGLDIASGPFQVKSLTSGHEDSEWGGGLDALDAIEAHDIAAWFLNAKSLAAGHPGTERGGGL